jgi:hypothetical protein
MKTFNRFFTEMIGTSHQDQAVDKNMNMGAFSDPMVVKKLNAFVGTIAGSYVLPEDAVHQLRSSLSKIGLSGSFELPLTSYGGRFGKGIDTPYDQFESDDGISHQVEGGLALVLNYEMQEDNSCRLTASIK